MKKYTNNGICYTWELVSDRGAGFILFPNQGQSKEDSAPAAAEILDSRDVVWLRNATESDWDDICKNAVFAEPAGRHLRWCEINYDTALIRNQRMVGTAPQKFVERWVLPFVAETKAKNEQLFGSRIYEI